MSADVTESIRRAMLPGMPAQLRAAAEAGEPILDTDELRELYTVEGFSAPFVVVRRKSDGQLGSMMFTHAPRYYFGFAPDA